MQGTRGARHRLLTLTVALTPFSAVPLEVPGLGGLGLGMPLAAAIVLIAVTTGVLRGKLTAVGALLGLLAVWVTWRLTIGAVTSGEAFDAGRLIRETGGLAAATCAFVLARREKFRPAIYRGLCIALGLSLAVGAYQLAAGLPTLLAAGYTSADGYHYYTADGAYRPFGGFAGPTTFGTFLAMVGAFVVLSMRPGWHRAAVFAAVVSGVLLTETRAAWIGCALAVLVVAVASPGVRRRAAGPVIFGGLTVGAGMLIYPAVALGIWERATSAIDQSDTSRVTRTALWEGVVSATQSRGRVLDGFGAGDWATIMSGEIGTLAQLGHAHSNFFQEWFRYGAIGFAIFVALVVAMLATAWRSSRVGGTYAAGALAAMVVYLADSVFNNSLSSTSFTVAAFLLLGMGARARPVRSGDRVDADLADAPGGEPSPQAVIHDPRVGRLVAPGQRVGQGE